MSEEKKLHWTQLPENKEKLRRIGVARWKSKRHGHRPKSQKRKYTRRNQNGKTKEALDVTAYTFGRVEGLIEGIAEGAGVPTSVLADRISKLLASKASRSVLGT